MLESADTMAMLTVLRNLGAHWECLAPGCYYLKSYQPQNLAHAYTLDAGNSGQVARFLPVIALGLGFQDLTIRGDASLSSIRDFSVLGQAPTSLGIKVTYLGRSGFLPVRLQGRLRAGAVTLSGLIPSQSVPC